MVNPAQQCRFIKGSCRDVCYGLDTERVRGIKIKEQGFGKSDSREVEKLRRLERKETQRRTPSLLPCAHIECQRSAEISIINDGFYHLTN